MKKHISMIIFFVMLFFYTTALYGGELKIIIEGIKVQKGYIRVGLYNNSQDFPIRGKEIKNASVVVNCKNPEYTFNDLTPGYYAVAVFHDINGNGWCDRGMMGFPKEPFGFSNNPKIILSAPTFEECSFKLDKKYTAVIVVHGYSE